MSFALRHVKHAAAAAAPLLVSVLLLAMALLRAPAPLRAQEAGGAAAAPPAKSAGGQIEMNFQNIDIASFLGIMSRLFAVPFVWDDQTVKGKITLQSVQKFSKEDAYKLFETALSMQGYTTLRVEGSPVVQVVPIQDAARLATPINPEISGGGAGNVFVTRIITLRYAEPEGVKNTLTPLLSKSTGVATYPPANALILADTEENLARYQKIIAELDIPPGDTEFVVIPLKYASARKLAPILTTIAAEVPQGRPARGRTAPQPQQQQGRKTSIASDDRTNSLIVSGDPADIPPLRKLIDLLDVPGELDVSGFKIYKLRHASASEIARILQQFKDTGTPVQERPKPRTPEEAQAAAATGSGPGNVVIAADRPTNSVIAFASPEILETFDRLVEALDVPGRSQDSLFKIYRLKHAAADEMAKLLEDVKKVGDVSQAGTERRGRAEGQNQQPAQAQPGDAAFIQISADIPTNTLIVFGPPYLIDTFDQLITALDIPDRVQPSTFKVYRLQHASAEDLAKVLSEVKEGAAVATGAASGAEGAAASQRSAQTARSSGRSSGRAAGIDIAADKATNSLIVFGTAENIRTMDSIITDLDVRRPQVYVEALIMEMTLEKSLQLGINWQGTARVGDSVVGGGFPNAQPQTLPQALSGGTGAALGIIGNEIEFQGQKFTTFSGFIQATRQDLDLNILANPQILTLDNEQAEINVSQVIPVSAKVVRDANLQTTTEFEFKDVGVILAITPQITGSDKVLLTIQQESSSVASQQVTANQNQQAITTLKRTISSKVLIDDGATMAIGGLIQDNTQETVTKVPCLGDIPVLGWFFKSRSEAVRKTNLIVFLRPHIIKTRDDLNRITNRAQERYDSTRGLGVDVENELRGGFELPPKPEPPPKE